MGAESGSEDGAKKMKLTESSDPKTCKHYVKRKKRFCKMTVAKGKEYCGEHADEEVSISEAETGGRIPCPLDNKHTVYAWNLQKHLKICNARAKDLPAYIVPDINLGPSIADEPSDKLKLSDVPADELNQLIERIELFYRSEIEGSIKEHFHTHEVLATELSNADYGHETMKHLIQTSSILGCLQHLDMMSNQTSFIDFGSGKGQLSFWLARSTSEFKDSKVILLDRASHRHKKDNKLEDKTHIHRIRADIADFDMRRLDLLRINKEVVAVSKHLCGAATDLALRCITQGQTASGSFNAITTKGFVIALCCHHRCDWRSFVGKDTFESCGFNRKDFNLITKMVSWAICGSGMSRERRKMIEERNLHGAEGKNDELNESENKNRISIEQKADIGIMCKRLLDYCRMRYMEENRFRSSLKYYVKSDVTLENVCLIGELDAVES